MKIKGLLEMETEVRTLRQDLKRNQESLKAATRRCRELVKELSTRTSDYERERLIRDQQLSRILRALLVLESRLKQEQKSIRQVMREKDNVIRNQQLEIAKLRRLTKSYIKGSRDQACGCIEVEICKDDDDDDVGRMDSADFQEHDSGLGKDIHNLKCEIITKLNESLEEQNQSTNLNNNNNNNNNIDSSNNNNSSNTEIKKTNSFAGSDISKVSLTSSENTDASIITTTTDGSPSLLSTEGFCEGESSDVSPGSTLNKCSRRCTPTSETELAMTTSMTMEAFDDERGGGGKIVRSESKDDGMDCNYASDDEDDDVDVEPLYENFEKNNPKNLESSSKPEGATERAKADDASEENHVRGRIATIHSHEHCPTDESSNNWYSDPDEDRINDELIRHSVYRPNSEHNSVLECVNQILLRDMEDEENVLSIPRRFKHRGKIVRFQPARLSDIESVGSEMERRNSDEPLLSALTSVATAPRPPPSTITTTVELADDNSTVYDNDDESTVNTESSFKGTNSEDEFGMRIIPPALNSESGIEEDLDDSKARPIVILEPVVKMDESNTNKANNARLLAKKKSSSPTPEDISFDDDNNSVKSLVTNSSNHDYEEIDSLPGIVAASNSAILSKLAPTLPPKPQFRNSTLILKKIPSPSFLIDETSAKKHQANERLNSVVLNPVRSLKFEDNLNLQKRQSENDDNWKCGNRLNNVVKPSSSQLYRPLESLAPKVTSIVKHFEEFKIDNNEDNKKASALGPTNLQVLDDYDIQQNFEEFKLDDCDLSKEPERCTADQNSDALSLSSMTNNLTTPAVVAESSIENNNSVATNNSTNDNCTNNGINYDNFLEATGLSNKSILTPSRMLSNHKSMLKPKDVKYKNKIKATAVMERHGPTTMTRHWTGPFV